MGEQVQSLPLSGAEQGPRQTVALGVGLSPACADVLLLPLAASMTLHP